VAAAAFSINTLDEPGIPGTPLTTIKSKKDGEAILTEEAGRVSKRFPGNESRALNPNTNEKINIYLINIKYLIYIYIIIYKWRWLAVITVLSYLLKLLTVTPLGG
jgi:hypothetical protein